MAVLFRHTPHTIAAVAATGFKVAERPAGLACSVGMRV